MYRVNGRRDKRLDREFRRYADCISRCLSARATMFDRDVKKWHYPADLSTRRASSSPDHYRTERKIWLYQLEFW